MFPPYDRGCQEQDLLESPQKVVEFLELPRVSGDHFQIEATEHRGEPPWPLAARSSRPSRFPRAVGRFNRQNPSGADVSVKKFRVPVLRAREYSHRLIAPALPGAFLHSISSGIR